MMPEGSISVARAGAEVRVVFRVRESCRCMVTRSNAVGLAWPDAMQLAAWLFVSSTQIGVEQVSSALLDEAWEGALDSAWDADY